MTFLPIVERELRVMARQRSAYWMRFSAAAGALGLGLLVLAVNRFAPVPLQAKTIFFVISLVCLGFAMLAGVFLTADCLSEERREGTLGLLFLTDLKGHDVVLGKLVSTSLLAVFNLVAVLPILALPLLMGGISGGEFRRITLVLLVTIFFSLATAMLVSAVSKDSRTAMLVALLVMVALAGGLPLLWWVQAIVDRSPVLDFLLWECPVYTFRRGLDIFYAGRVGPNQFWFSLATLFALGVVSLAAASLLLPRVWQEAKLAKVKRAGAVKRSARRFGSPAQQAARRGLRNDRPFYWLATRDRLPKVWADLCLGALLPFWLLCFCGIFVAPRGTADNCFSATMFMSYGLHLIYKCLVAVEASRRLSEDWHSGALELLLATPLQPREIRQAQQDAVWDAFAWPRRMLVGMNLLLVWMMAGPNPLEIPGEPLRIISLMLLGGIALLYLDTFALTRTGMWTALTTTRHTRAVLRTLRRVMLLPWVAILLLYLMGTLGRSPGEGMVEILLAIWFFIGIVLDLVFGTLAESNLRGNFRAAAAGVYPRRIQATDGLPASVSEGVEG